MVLAVLVLWVSTSYAQDTDADQAKALLQQGIAQYNALNFKGAQAILLQVERSALSQADQNLLDEYLGAKIEVALQKQMAAMAAYKSAEKALKVNQLTKAKEGFSAAAASEYLPAAMRQDAKAQLAVVIQKIRIAQQAAEAQIQPSAPAPTSQPTIQATPLPPAEPSQTQKPSPEPVETVVEALPQPELTETTVEALPQPELMETTVEALPQDEPPVQTEAERLVTIMENRRVQARELLVLGQQAMDEHQPERAVAYFQRALALTPDSEEAQRQLAFARQMTGTVGESGIISRLEQQRAVARQVADVDFDMALKRAEEILARAASDAEFENAIEATRVGRNVLETNKSLFSEPEYRQRLIRVETLLEDITQRQEQWQRDRVQKQMQEIQQREVERQQRETERRRLRIETLTERARTLRSEQKYDQALEVTNQILKLDPTNERAAEQVDMLQQLVLLQQDKDIHLTQRYEEKRQLIDLRRAEIPWYELVKYPHDWKELTIRREPFGAGRIADSEADRLLHQRLATRIERLEYPEVNFVDVIQDLRDQTGVNIHPKWNMLLLARVEQRTPVNVDLNNVTFEKGLEVVLEDVGGVGVPLGYVVSDGVITISTKDDLATRTLTLVYDIRDLIVRVPNFAGRDVDLSAVSGGNDGGGGFFDGDTAEDNEDNVSTKSELINNIMYLIQQSIDPNSWMPIGTVGAPGGGSISELGGQFVITQTAENHKAIRDLIGQLREARAMQVAIEARFITVNSGFLNSIGLDLDFYFNLGSRLGSTTVTDPFTSATVPTTGGVSGWGSGRPGNERFTPIGVMQNGGFANVLGLGSGIGAEVTNHAFSVGGTFLDDIQVDFLIQATQAHASTRSLTAPRLTLLNGSRANITLETEQAYIADLEPVVAENAVLYDPVPGVVSSGTSLDVEATISADRRYVTLTVIPVVSNVDSFTPFAVNAAEVNDEGEPISGTGFLQLPTYTRQRLQTTVSVPDGGTLLLGGQRLSTEVDREIGVPLLNKVPILKRMFSNRGMIRDEETLLILIKPKIIIQPEEEERQFPE